MQTLTIYQYKIEIYNVERFSAIGLAFWKLFSLKVYIESLSIFRKYGNYTD